MRHTLPHPHIRKPILISIGVIFVTILVHLIGVYIYTGGHYVGLAGGSTSIALVEAAPDMSKPLSYGKNPADEIVYPLIYRGLIRYNPESMIAQSNLAECDISKIERITCTLKQEQHWSDGTVITGDDVIATFRAFAEAGENPGTSEVLRDTRIEAKGDVITFVNTDRDPQILKLLTYPILRSDVLEQIRTGRFVVQGHITSGQYKFSEQVRDTAYIHDRITLVSNPATSQTKPWFDKIHFKFFENIGALENAQDTLGVIIPPPQNENMTLSERFRSYTYTTQEYFSVFFQTDRLSKDIRNILHWQIGTSISGVVNIDHKSVINIFAGKSPILPQGDIGNFADIMRKKGYMKRDDWITTIESTSTYLTGDIVYDKPVFFSNKQNSNTLFYSDATGGILLSGTMSPTVSTVIINGYQLKEYKAGNKKFSYRVSLEDGTLKEGKNTYLLEGKVGDTATITGEVLTVYYTPDTAKLAEYKKTIDDEYIARNNTPALIAEREREKQSKKESALALDPQYYHDKAGTPFRVKIAYVSGPQSTELYALAIQKSLENLSIMTELVVLDPKALQSMIVSGKKDYDILIAGVSAGGTIAGIGQLFASSEAKKGVNFSNIESERLDTLFVELRSATTGEKIEKITNDIIEIMNSESFFFPISSPIHTLYVDRNLKGIRNMSLIPGPTAIYDVLEFASIKDAYVFKTEGKNPFRFLVWLGDILAGQENNPSPNLP